MVHSHRRPRDLSLAMVILIAWPWNHALSVAEAAKDPAPVSARIVLGNRERGVRRFVHPASTPQTNVQAPSQIDAAEEDDDGLPDFVAWAIAGLQPSDIETVGSACSPSPKFALRPLSVPARYRLRC